MRTKGNPFHRGKAIPRMSWSPVNLYNLFRRTVDRGAPESREINWNSTSKTLFQQRWLAKKLVRGFHGEHIKESQFKKWYLPKTLPDVRPNPEAWPEDLGERGDAAKQDAALLEHYAQRKRLEKLAEMDEEAEGEHDLAPVGSLMLTEVERRIDTVVFRSCFAHSIWDARRLVIHGHVKLNGVEHRNSNTRLKPGDMITVNPEKVTFLQQPTEQEVQQWREWKAWYEHTMAVSGDPTAFDIPEPSCQWDHVLDRIREDLSKEDRLRRAAKLTARIRRPASGPRQDIHRLKVDDIPPVTPFRLPFYSSPWLFVPANLEVSYNTCSAIYVRHPTARPGYSEIPTPYEADGEIIRSAWDWYAHRRPRIASKRKISQMPEDRNFQGLESAKDTRKQLEFSRRVRSKVEEWRREDVRALQPLKSALGFGAGEKVTPEALKKKREAWDKEKKARRADWKGVRVQGESLDAIRTRVAGQSESRPSA